MTVHQLGQAEARQLIDAGRVRAGLLPVDDSQPTVRRPLNQVEARAVLDQACLQHGLAPVTDGERRAAIAEAQWSAAAAGGPSEASPAAAVLGRDDLVTRPVCLTHETFAGSWGDESAPFFCDWMSISQEHFNAEPLPTVDAGCIWRADTHGEIEWKTVAAVKHTGSHETHLLVRSDGSRVSLSGNLSRFGRADNVFGYSVRECIERANVVLAGYGLPAFTAGERVEYVQGGRVRAGWTGARISRLDLTANWLAGSEDNARGVLQWLGTQHNGRKAGRVLGNGATVDWGIGSRRQYWKAYIKAAELLVRRKKGCIVDDRVLQYCLESGLVRFEGTIRSNALTDIGAAYLGDFESGWAMGQLISLYNEHSAVMHRAQASTDDLGDLPAPLRLTASDYLAGRDTSKGRSRATWYRHRQALLQYGIDIAIMNIAPFQPRVRIIELTPATVPSWYQLAA